MNKKIEGGKKTTDEKYKMKNEEKARIGRISAQGERMGEGGRRHLWISGKDERREHGGDSDGESGQTRELLHEGSTTLYGGDPGF